MHRPNDLTTNYVNDPQVWLSELTVSIYEGDYNKVLSHEILLHAMLELLRLNQEKRKWLFIR